VCFQKTSSKHIFKFQLRKPQINWLVLSEFLNVYFNYHISGIPLDIKSNWPNLQILNLFSIFGWKWEALETNGVVSGGELVEPRLLKSQLVDTFWTNTVWIVIAQQKKLQLLKFETVAVYVCRAVVKKISQFLFLQQ
jgi:hypothetical protein